MLLKNEYSFYRSKYQLTPIKLPLHFLRMRPSNFPTIRLAQLAMLVHHSSHLFSKNKRNSFAERCKKILNVTAMITGIIICV
ncbi:MAG: DUF2851 family protein [Ferruginibacter sp.]